MAYFWGIFFANMGGGGGQNCFENRSPKQSIASFFGPQGILWVSDDAQRAEMLGVSPWAPLVSRAFADSADCNGLEACRASGRYAGFRPFGMGRRDPSPNLLRGARKFLVKKRQKQSITWCGGILFFPGPPCHLMIVSTRNFGREFLYPQLHHVMDFPFPWEPNPAEWIYNPTSSLQAVSYDYNPHIQESPDPRAPESPQKGGGLFYLRLGLFYLRLVFVTYGGLFCYGWNSVWSFLLTVEIRFGLVCLRRKIG